MCDARRHRSSCRSSAWCTSCLNASRLRSRAIGERGACPFDSTLDAPRRHSRIADGEAGRGLQRDDLVLGAKRFDVALQSGDALGIVAIGRAAESRRRLLRSSARSISPRETCSDFAARVADQSMRLAGMPKRCKIGEHRLRAGDAQERRLDDDEEPRRARDERTNRGREGLRRVDQIASNPVMSAANVSTVLDPSV